MDYIRVIPTITLSEITDEVRSFYNSFFESGLSIDDTIFLPRVRYILKKLSLPIHSIKKKVIEVENYKASLPKDYYKLLMALGCFERCEYIPPSPLDPVEITEFKTDYKINECVINECKNECNEYLNIIQRVNEGTLIKYNNVVPLSMSTRTYKSCHKDCFNRYIDSEDQIDIIDNVINTNFENGNIYIQYYTSNLSEEGEYLIPENDIIRTAFFENMKEIVLEYIVSNTTQDIKQLYGLQIEKARLALNEAKILVKTPTYQQSLDIGNYMRNKFVKYWKVVRVPNQVKFKY